LGAEREGHLGWGAVAAVWIASMFFWFALMEFLQFIQYLVINNCSNPVNIFWTTFGWIHIAFQPSFSNLAMSALNKGNLRKE
jgi:hypothetical protein